METEVYCLIDMALSGQSPSIGLSQQLVVGEPGIPIRPTALGSQIEQIPQWPDKIGMPRFLPVLHGCIQKLCIVEMVDTIRFFLEDIDGRHLPPLFVFRKVIRIVAVVLG